MSASSKSLSRIEPSGRILADRVKDLRKRQGLTLDQLAANSGVSRSMLSQIERARANPTLAVTHRIAQCFDMTIGELVDQTWTHSNIEVIRAKDPGYLFRSDSNCSIRTLSPLHMVKSIEFYQLTLTPGAQLQSAAHFRGTREMLTVSEGVAEIQSGADVSRIKQGDCASYRADTDHGIRNCGKGELITFLVVTYSYHT